ncbi:MAG: hypothetical protein KF709_04890 [Gemmatimonadaceae bacterium]|nr:hypothetical protein [Gemmatimonadaceae bacterium]
MASVVWAIVYGVVRVRQIQSRLADPALAERLGRMESALDAIAIEVERIGESQRFSARLGGSASGEERASIAREASPH